MADEMVLQVVFFRTDGKNEPVRKWLLSMSEEDRKIIGTNIMTVQFRWPLGMPLVRKIAPGLWEVRSKISDQRIARVMFTVINSEMILLHGFIKKSQTTSATDLPRQKIEGKHGYKEVDMTQANRHRGSGFDDFLKKDGVYDEVRAEALKRVVVMEVEDIIREKKLRKARIAKKMETSRSQLDRLLDPKNTGVSLDSLDRLADALGKQLKVEFT